MTTLTIKAKIRDLQTIYDRDHADWLCVYGMCTHDAPPPTLPGGIVAIVATGWAESRRQRAILARYTRREYGGWHVRRADSGRVLGWLFRRELGEYQGMWAAHVASGAFTGTGPDDEGDVLDDVPTWLYNGEDRFRSQPIDYTRDRLDGAASIVSHLFREHAPAVGHPRHCAVKPYTPRIAH